MVEFKLPNGQYLLSFCLLEGGEGGRKLVNVASLSPFKLLPFQFY